MFFYSFFHFSIILNSFSYKSFSFNFLNKHFMFKSKLWIFIKIFFRSNLSEIIPERCLIYSILLFILRFFLLFLLQQQKHLNLHFILRIYFTKGFSWNKNTWSCEQRPNSLKIGGFWVCFLFNSFFFFFVLFWKLLKI